MTSFDVIVVGGGHAGCEAAAAAARRGARTALITMSRQTIGAMSCNPAIGGIGKGHLVREIDVFDGVIARAADAAAIHHRMLNASKGAAVRGPRVQADRILFSAAVQRTLAATDGLTIIEGQASALDLQAGRIAGLSLGDGTVIEAGAVVLATGTFLGGRLFRGDEVSEGGRVGEAAGTVLAAQLRELGLPIGRLKTGTPPRLDGRTIRWDRLGIQASDRSLWTMSPATRHARLPQLFCAITRTNERTHDVVRSNMQHSPLISGAIVGRGPRYCPSIEDKVRRFGDRDGHQIFLEPEGLRSPLIYPNGISTSLPPGAQEKMIRTIDGLDGALIVEPGYAVEYDHVDPRALTADLATRDLPGLFMAGQINGTTGYEEAAAQGLVAGLNAAGAAKGLGPVRFARSQSYIGVMIDDLTLQGVTEPYRMLTARAEHRLHLRADNAEQRLGDLARDAGCLSASRADMLARRDDQRASARAATQHRPIETHHNRPGEIPGDIREEIAEDERYAPYVARQHREADAARRADRPLPSGIDYRTVRGLSAEMVERLQAARPATVGDAARIRGITAAAVTALLVATSRAAA